MKIEQLTLRDFKCFAALNVPFTKPVTLIFGENAAGKTTIAQAIALALTGRLNGSSDRRSLVRHEAGDFSVTVSVSQNGTPGRLERYELQQCTSSRESTDPETLLRGLKTNRETLGALLETTSFLELHPDEKKRLLFALMPQLQVDESNMAQHLDAWLKARPELLAKHGIPACVLQPDRTLAEELLDILASPATLEEAYNRAYEERRIVRRELKLLGDPPPLPPALTREQLEADINKKQSELAAFHVASGETKGMAVGSANSLSGN